MRLFSKPDGKVDRLDRAQWMTPVFDRPFQLNVTVIPVPTTGTPKPWLKPRSRPARSPHR